MLCMCVATCQSTKSCATTRPTTTRRSSTTRSTTNSTSSAAYTTSRKSTSTSLVRHSPILVVITTLIIHHSFTRGSKPTFSTNPFHLRLLYQPAAFVIMGPIMLISLFLVSHFNFLFTEFTEGHQYWRTDGLVGTGLMPYKAHSLKYQHFMLFPVPVYSKYEI